MEQQRVEITGSEMVKPARCLDKSLKLKLTGFDLLIASASVPYQQRILFFQSTSDSFEEILQLLKQSLAQVLTLFYPLAGRLSSDENGEPLIDCQAGQSVKFVEAVTDSTLEELGEFQPSKFCDSLCDMGSALPKHPWTTDDPLLLIQVTRFMCGGLSLGFAFNHQVVDGTSAWHFMTSWAELARTGSVRNPPDITYSVKFLQLTPEQIALQGKEMEVMTPPGGKQSKRSPPVLVTKTFNLEPSLIQKLKADAAAASNGTRFSAFVVISAYFWRKVTLARQLPQSSKTRFVIVFNCRERVSTLSKFYFGNAASGLSLILEAGEIEREDGLLRCTTVLHRGISGCRGEDLQASVAFCLQCLRNLPKGDSEGMDYYDKNVVLPIGSPRHPVYESDFGFGKPAGVTFGMGDLGDGKLYMFPSAKGDGGVTATIVLPSEVMERLAKQEEA